MKLLKNERCSGCLACYNRCPKDAIILSKDKNGFICPQIVKDKCVDCGLCEKSCPSINKNTCAVSLMQSYACYIKDEKKRVESSSGGVFSAIAEYIISIGGVVYGARFDKNWSVIHKRVDNISALQELKTSKYVQSFIGDTYKQAQADLKNGVTVLFTGTPCQIEGLYGFLGNHKYENLITQDIVCHGVPSEKAWRKYIDFRKSKDLKDEIKAINFRNKKNGWSEFGISFSYFDGSYFSPNNKDYYFKTFLHNYSLRSSCYNCDFKSTERISDITLADFWGIYNVLPNFDSYNGVSLLIVNSEKGRELFDSVKENLVYEQTDFNKSIEENPAMTKSVKKPLVRKYFFKNLDKIPFDILVNKSEKKNKSFLHSLIRKIFHIIKN